MSRANWTEEQRQAIWGHGGSILVSAAAGSGKTAVLVERVVELITREEDPVDADRLLVVTFSNAAAREMKQRIARRLWEMAREDPGNSRLARQQLLLESAQISTIHSFCVSLIRGYFQLLGIPAEFRIAEERELDLLRMRAVQELIEEEYVAGEDSFFDLVELISTARSDRGLERNILKLYDFLRNHPFYENWMAQVLEGYDASRELSGTPWAAILLDYAADALDHCLSLNRAALELMAGDEEMSAAYQRPFQEDAIALESCRRLVKEKNWDACCREIAGFSFVTLGRLTKKYPFPERKEKVKRLRDEVKEIVKEKLQKRCFFMDSAQYKADMEQQRPVIQKLFQLAARFGRRLDEVKLERSLLDFGDLEHYALALLYQEDGKGGHALSPVAREVAERYDEILVDEYQDTNAAQEMIFGAVSRGKKNLFMVGDVKQSIYRFRQARPEIFLDKKERFAPYDGVTFPAKIALSANFRTRRETTGLINDLFAAAMCPAVGEMEYGEEDRLIPRADYSGDASCPVVLALVDPAEGEKETAEAEYIAREIETLLARGTMVEVKGNRRPMAPGDICILLRSPKNKAERYSRALEKRKIRFWAERQGGFLDAKEIAPVVALLKLIGNPLLDLELAQVLLSPLYRYTPDQVARLRAESKADSLYSIMTRSMTEENGDFRRFWEDYHRLRQLAATLSPQELLMELYAATGLMDKVRVMPQGETRVANLRLLLDYAAAFQQRGGDFGDFVDYLTALAEYDCDLRSATATAGDAVSIMSIHKSKGLEFPVVFLADTAGRMNLQDLGNEVLLDPELGAACVLRDNRRMREHDTIARTAMGEKNRKALLSEELRLLYVAMTRARERLYLVATDPGLGRLAAAASRPFRGGRLSPWAMRCGQCLYDWLAGVLVHHPGFDTALLEDAWGLEQMKGCQGVLEVRHILGRAGEEDTSSQETASTRIDQDALERMRTAAAFRYPFAGDVVTPSKLSVSELVREIGREEERYFFTRRPKTMTRQAMTPTERGIAAHKFMQFADLEAAFRSPEEEITRLRDRGFITTEEAEQMDRGMIERFFASAIGKRVMGAERVYREIRFLKEFSRAELELAAPGLGIQGDTVIQGIADCVILEDGQGTIIDYKTDRAGSMEELARRYGEQLELYRAILEEYLGVPIREKVLYSFALGKEIRVG